MSRQERNTGKGGGKVKMHLESAHMVRRFTMAGLCLVLSIWIFTSTHRAYGTEPTVARAVSRSSHAGSEVTPGGGADAATTYADLAFVRNLKVSARNDTLNVKFDTPVNARCRLDVGYDPRRPRFRTSRETAGSSHHAMRVSGLLPGTVFFRISGTIEEGGKFEEAVLQIVLGGGPDGPPQATADTPERPQDRKDGSTPGDDGMQPATGMSAETGDRQPGSSVDERNEQQGGTDTAPAETQPDGSDGNAGVASAGTDAGDTAENETDEEAAAEEEGVPPLPNADTSTELGRKALAAARIDRSFGPGSIPTGQRERLIAKIKTLRQEYDDYQDAQGARALAKTYMALRHYRKALQYATEAVQKDPNDAESLGIRLAIYRKFGMGWKVKETYRRLLRLSPGDRNLLRAYERDSKLFGDFKGIGKPKKVEIKF